MSEPTPEHRDELDERIDASLRRSFGPPPDEVIRTMVETTASPVRSRRLWRQSLAIAAAIMLLVCGTWLAVNALRPRPESLYGPWRSLEQVYADTISTGFTPQWVCENDEEFMTTFRDHYGQRLLLNPGPDEAALGLSYCNSITNQTVSLLARVQGEPVMIFVDRLDRDDREWPEPESPLHLFRRELGDLVLYEMTPMEQPALLERFTSPGNSTTG